MMLADAATAGGTPSWTSTIAVLSMCGTGVMLLLTALMVYYMKVQSDSFRDQTELLRHQASTPQQIQQPVNVTISEELHNVFAGKSEFEKHLGDFKEKHAEIWRTLRGENQRIGAEVVATREAIAGLEATTTLQNQQLAAIQGDIKQLLQRHA